MTHDELLAKVTHGYRWTCDRDTEPWEALRAIVELHKPFNETSSFCKGCTKIAPRNERDGASFTGDVFVTFPCATIQAVEKELK